MITYLKGDIFSSPAQVLVNTVNTVGVMGKGVALEFKKRYPEMFTAYERVCKAKQLEIGKLFLWKGPEKWVLMFPTKVHWRNPSKIEYIEAVLQKFSATYADKGITSAAFPRLGCGNGGLDWKQVQPLMEQYLKNLPIPIYIYVGSYQDQIPEHIEPEPMERWLHTHPGNIGFAVLEEDLKKNFSQEVILPLKNGKYGRAQWSEDGIILKNGQEVTLSATELCEFWVYIRDSGVVSMDRLPKEFSPHAELLLKVLEKLDYLQPVLTSLNGVDFSDGYQYIE